MEGLKYKGILIEQLPIELAMEALTTIPVTTTYYMRMALILIEQHKKITLGGVENIITERKKRA